MLRSIIWHATVIVLVLAAHQRPSLAQDRAIALDIPAQFSINFPAVSPSACWRVDQPADGRLTASVTGKGEWDLCIADTACPSDCMNNGLRSVSTERLRAGRYYYVKVETRSPGVTATLAVYPSGGGTPGVVGGSVAGLWDSSEGPLTLAQQGNTVSGSHNKAENGEVAGTLTGNVFDGFWIEDKSDQRCATARNGRYFWGRIRLTFTGDVFEGKWGYCDGDFRGPWTGTRKTAASISGLWDTNLEGPLTLKQEGNTVTGIHNAVENGEMVGTLSGNVFDGFWIEDKSDQKCATTKKGRYFWGRIQMTFTGGTLDGKWGYCDGGLQGSFQGTKKNQPN
jgi:hypothetical protein